MRNILIGASITTVSILGLLAIMAMAAPAVDDASVGKIIAWAGDAQSLPADWMLCDGKILNKKQYPELYKAIGDSWGAPNRKRFNLPDLRGRFVRGADLGSGRDPDAGEREAANGGGNESGVGSVQQDSFQNHSHDNYKHSHQYTLFDRQLIAIYITLPGGGSNNVIIGDPLYKDQTDEEKVGIAGAKKYGTKGAIKAGEETRPANAAVNFIIKVR